MPQETDRLKLPLPLGNETVTRESINGIFEKIDAGVATQADLDTLREAVSQMDIPDASHTVKGKTQLSSVTDSTLEDRAATPKAVKAAYDRGSAGVTAAGIAQVRADYAYTEATAAKQLGVEQKANVVAALNSIGVSASTSEIWAQLITKMAGVIRSTGNAKAAQVLSGATFSIATANGIAGTMPNRSTQAFHQPAQETSVFQGDKAFMRPPAGYYDGSSWVYTVAPDLKAENIPVGKTILGVPGSLVAGVKPGLVLQAGSDPYANGNLASTHSTDPIRVREVTILTGGVYRVSYHTRSESQRTNYAYSQLYINGAARGALRQTDSGQTTLFVEDISLTAGEVLQLYLWTSSPYYRAHYLNSMVLNIDALISSFR
ncbi:hypothetical protein C0Q44_16500 [Paenibacillus sp. PCH8]|uniref:tail fiber protein n=1 Tax=Paenibacillus sp. PCH8 TaxID=2066524 RepID=UPI000CF958FD|nr:phage tail protein [Paenibacillus sp. PCH8]PQP82962.1 hypothetical protein C0Q44_16500 [Paenibacillus sp. PCH8]